MWMWNCIAYPDANDWWVGFVSKFHVCVLCPLGNCSLVYWQMGILDKTFSKMLVQFANPGVCIHNFQNTRQCVHFVWKKPGAANVLVGESHAHWNVCSGWEMCQIVQTCICFFHILRVARNIEILGKNDDARMSNTVLMNLQTMETIRQLKRSNTRNLTWSRIGIWKSWGITCTATTKKWTLRIAFWSGCGKEGRESEKKAQAVNPEKKSKCFDEGRTNFEKGGDPKALWAT